MEVAFLTLVPGPAPAHFGAGEMLTLLSALLYAIHIIYTGHVMTKGTVATVTTIQPAAVAVGCFIAALHDGIALPQRTSDWLAIVYMAVICGSATALMQAWAQTRVSPAKAAVIMSTEPIWAAENIHLQRESPQPTTPLLAQALLTTLEERFAGDFTRSYEMARSATDEYLEHLSDPSVSMRRYAWQSMLSPAH